MNKLNLGCGPDWKTQYPDYDGLDINDYGQKYQCSILLFDTGEKYEEVMANHFLEHFDQDEVKKILNFVHRILSEGGIFRFTVPHKDKNKAWILSHKTFWNECTVEHLCDPAFCETYGFPRWELIELVTNKRQDIHVILKKI